MGAELRRLAQGPGLDHRLPARLAARRQGGEQPWAARADRGARPARPARLLRRHLPPAPRGLRGARPRRHRSGLPDPDVAGRGVACGRRRARRPRRHGLDLVRHPVLRQRCAARGAGCGGPGADAAGRGRPRHPAAGRLPAHGSATAGPRGVYLSASATPARTADDGALLRGAGLAVLATLLEGADRASRAAGSQAMAGVPAFPPPRRWRRSCRPGASASAPRCRTPRRRGASGSSWTWWSPASRAWPPTVCCRGRGSTASTTSTTGSGWPGTARPPTRWTPRSCAACTTSPSPTRTATGPGRASPPGWACSCRGGCSSTSRARSSGACRPAWARSSSPRSTRRCVAAGWSSASSHRLDRLRLGPGRSVAAVELTRQAEPAAGRAGYDPLIRVGGLPCWPDRPLAGQLAGDPGDGLETFDGPTPGTGTETLRAGADFDVAVLAVSVGMVPHVADELIAAEPAWRRMVENLSTVATQSAQLWFDATESELGWSGPAGVTLSGFGDTFDTWASMSHLLARESWPSPGGPRSLAYLCGALPDVDPAHAPGRRPEVADALPGAGGRGAVAGRAGRARLPLGPALGRRGPHRPRSARGPVPPGQPRSLRPLRAGHARVRPVPARPRETPASPIWPSPATGPPAASTPAASRRPPGPVCSRRTPSGPAPWAGRREAPRDGDGPWSQGPDR